MAADMEDAAAAVAAAFGSQHVPPSSAASLRALLPGALFLRASVRCGRGLFVSDDLLLPGHTELSVVALSNSLAGVAMAQGRPVVVAAPSSGAAPAAAHVLCVPVGVAPAEGGRVAGGAGWAGGVAPPAERPLHVGALMVGCGAPGGAPPELWRALCDLAAAAAPYFLLLGLTKAAEMAEVLKLRAADCGCGPGEDALQDVPLSACTPPLSPRDGRGGGGGAQAPAGAAHEPGTLHAAAAAALALRSRLAGGVRGDAAASGSGSCAPAAQPAGGADEAGGDPKAELKAARAPLAPPPPPAGALLRYADPRLEARFAAAHNAGALRGDLLCALLHLAAAACFAAVHPAALLASPHVLAFVAAMSALPALLLADRAWYCRHREALLAALLLAHAALLRGFTLPPLLAALPPRARDALPWLLRATGAEALAVFALGFKLRLAVFAPVQAVCLAVVMSALAVPAMSAVQGVLPSTHLGASGAALLLVGGLLPAAAMHHSEARARRRFERALAAET